MQRLLILLLMLSLPVAGWAERLNPSTANEESDPADPDILEFAFITDTHGYGNTADVRESAPNIARFVDYCHENPAIRFALFGGDLINSYETDRLQALWCLRQARADFSPLRIPMYFTRGNHDSNGKQKTVYGKPDNSQIITDAQYYRLFSPLSATNPLKHPEGIIVDPVDPQGNYFYRDFPSHRFRMIVLNNYNQDSLEMFGVRGQQMKWLAEIALDFSTKENPEEWCFLLLTHAFTVNYQTNPAGRLLHAYVNGEDYRDEDMGVSYEGRFGTPKRAKMVGILGGHFHEDIYENVGGYNLIISNRGYATSGEIGTRREICFDHFRLNTRTRTLEQRRIGRGLSHLYDYNKPRKLQPRIAFPALEGIAAMTHGGRNGRTIHVTNLDDSGPGSLRWAVGQKGCRRVVFDVAGTIALQSPLYIEHDSLTLYGQASPEAGITIDGAPVIIKASQVIIRYLTLKEGIADYDFGQRNIILSHLTASATQTAAISIQFTHLATVQDCLIEGTIDTTDPGLRSRAGLVAGGCLTSFVYNHIRNCATAIRLPNYEGRNRSVHIARNLIENWGSHCMTGGGRQGEYTIEQNYLIPGPQTKSPQMLEVAKDGTGRYYVSGNRMEGYSEYDRNNALMVADRSGVPYDPPRFDEETRLRMDPFARPHKIDFAKTCLTIAAFQYKYMFGRYSVQDLAARVRRLAGSAYRPEKCDPDSLRNNNIENYLNEIVRPERSIVILYENDTHYTIDRYPYLPGLRETLRHDSASIGIVTAGAFFHDFKGNTSVAANQRIAEIMRIIGYDVIGLSRRDIISSPQETRTLLDNVSSAVTSLDLRATEQDSLLFAPYIIRQYDRRKVAFIGLSNYAEVPNLFERVQQTVNDARRDGAEYVILLSHLGENDREQRPGSHSLIAATTGIDVVLDGSSNHAEGCIKRLANKTGHAVLYSHTGHHFSHIGKLVIDRDGFIYSELIPTDSLLFKDPQTAAIVDSISL